MEESDNIVHMMILSITTKDVFRAMIFNRVLLGFSQDILRKFFGFSQDISR